jgi:hypothetical protein
MCAFRRSQLRVVGSQILWPFDACANNHAFGWWVGVRGRVRGVFRRPLRRARRGAAQRRRLRLGPGRTTGAARGPTRGLCSGGRRGGLSSSRPGPAPPPREGRTTSERGGVGRREAACCDGISRKGGYRRRGTAAEVVCTKCDSKVICDRASQEQA